MNMSTVDAPFHLPPDNGPSLDQIQDEIARAGRAEQVALRLFPRAFDAAKPVDRSWERSAWSEAERRLRESIDNAIADVRDEERSTRIAAAVEFAEHLLRTGAVRP